jgi:nucleoside-diphosphate-sugar epimerase
VRILVAGGAGFIGSHLVDRLLDDGHAVVAADNFLTGRSANLTHLARQPRFQLVRQDMTEALVAPAFAERFDRIYNLASPASPRDYTRYPLETHLVNALGTLHALELARDHGARFLQASTSEVYGEPLVHPQAETYWGNVNPNGPRACYDEGKRFAESLTMTFVRRFELDARIARIFNTYGPRARPDDGRVVPNFCVQALRGEPLTIYGDGSQTRSFCYVADLVTGLVSLMETDGLAGEVINLGNPDEQTIRGLADQILALVNSSSPLHFALLPFDDPTRRQPDVAKAARLLGWRPTVPLAAGLAATIDSFARELAIAR